MRSVVVSIQERQTTSTPPLPTEFTFDCSESCPSVMDLSANRRGEGRK